jgi:hypothetical protein
MQMQLSRTKKKLKGEKGKIAKRHQSGKEEKTLDLQSVMYRLSTSV